MYCEYKRSNRLLRTQMFKTHALKLLVTLQVVCELLINTNITYNYRHFANKLGRLYKTIKTIMANSDTFTIMQLDRDRLKTFTSSIQFSMYKHVHMKIGVAVLIAIAFFPITFEKRIFNILYALLLTLSVTIYVTIVIAQFAEILVATGNTLQDYLALLGVAFLFLETLGKNWLIRRPTIQRLFERLKATEINVINRNGLDGTVRDIYMRFVCKNYVANCFVFVSVATSGLMHVLTPVLTEHFNPPEVFFDMVDNSTVVYRPRPLPLVSWFPFDRYKYYKISFTYHSIVAFDLTLYIIGGNNFLNGLILFVVGQLVILQEQILHVGKIDDDEHVEMELRRCVIYHKNIIQYVEDLSNAMRVFLLFEFFMVGMQFAVLTFEAIMGGWSFATLNSVVFLVNTGVQLFFFYWNANEIILESMNVANAAYESKWYNYNERNKKTLLILMIRAQRPLTLSVGPLYAMSTQTMVSILRAAYSYTALMRRLYANA